VFPPDEIVIVQVMNCVVRRCVPLGSHPVTGKYFDRRAEVFSAASLRSRTPLPSRTQRPTSHDGEDRRH
jgi:hypothetical protein